MNMAKSPGSKHKKLAEASQSQAKKDGTILPGASENVSLVLTITALTHRGLSRLASFTPNVSFNWLAQIRFMQFQFSVSLDTILSGSLRDWMEYRSRGTLEVDQLEQLSHTGTPG